MVRPLAGDDAQAHRLEDVWTRAAPLPSERLTFAIEMVSG